ncbi:MAG: YceI family protein [Pseudomonadota bacterium]
MRSFFVMMLVSLCGSGMAQAVEYSQVLPGESRVQFAYTQMGVPMDGSFGKFQAQVHFDPAQPAHASAQIDIDIASIDTGSAEANSEVLGAVWFDAKTHPRASFVASGMQALGGARYLASGQLTIKGHTQPVQVPVTFQAPGARGVFEGTLDIKRLDYAIGTGEWADVSAVADEIRIRFHIVVQSATHK